MIGNYEAQNYNTEEKPNLDKEIYWKEIFYIVHVITLEETPNSRSNNKPVIYSRSKYFFLKCDNHMLHLSVKKSSFLTKVYIYV